MPHGEITVRNRIHGGIKKTAIQEFWSGVSFYGSDERNELSYSLALILVELLGANWDPFLDFILRADYRDGGQNASLEALDRCLGETMAEFLGPGNWRPQRKIIAAHQRRAQRADPTGARNRVSDLSLRLRTP